MLKSYSQEYIRNSEDADQCLLPRNYKQKQGRTEIMDKFSQIFKRIKLKSHLQHFIRNIKRNNIFSQPIDFQPSQVKSHWIDIKGIEINHKIENIVLGLDIIFTLANFVLSTFQAFLPEYQQFKDAYPYIVIINIIAVIIYLFKTVVSLINQDVEHGVHYVYLTDIIKKELIKGRFIVQISLAIIIIINITITAEYQTLQIIGIIYFVLCIMKIFNLSFSLAKIELMVINNAKKERYWNLCKVLICNLLFAHFMASIFLAMLKMSNNLNWYHTKSKRVVDPYWFELYVWAYYWACTTMITIGYGDFVPVNAGQAAVVSAIQILSSIIIAYNISQIGSIIQSINEKSKVINSKIGLLRRINKKNKIPMAINIELEQYIVESEKIQEDFQYSKHQQLISSMPEQLQQKYYQAAIINIYRKLPFFMNLGKQTLMIFFQEQIGKVYYPGEFIIKKKFAQQIYVVLKGQLEFCYKKLGSTLNGTVIQRVEVNYQNNIPILLAKNVLNKNQGIYFDIKATKYSYGVRFSIDKFMQILKQSQIDYHYYLMTLDLHHAQSSLAINKCNYCTNSFHTKFQCPKLHFMPLTTIVISKYNCVNKLQSPIQKRLLFYRKKPQFKVNHVYKLKNQLSSPQQFQMNLDLIDSKSYLQIVLILFGDKSIEKRNISNKITKKILAQQLLIIHIYDQEKEEMQSYEVIKDFHHYFAAFNVSKLEGISLSKKKKEQKPYLLVAKNF